MKSATPGLNDSVFAVGIVGVGNMGGAMAANLLERGWTVHVNDLDSAKIQNIESFGAIPSVNGSQLAMNCEAVIVCVVDAAQTDDVLFGALGVAATLRPGRAVLLCPTMAPDDVERFAARLAERGLHAIDAPMSGGPARARDGSMSLMVACADDVFEAHRALIEALSTKVFRISERRALAGDFAPRAHVTLLEKDTRLAVEAAQAAGFAGPLGCHASAVFVQAHAAGLALEDDAAIFKLLRGA